MGTGTPSEAFEGLLKKIPPSANALVMIDVENTVDTPVAREQGWGEELEQAYVSRPIFLPPEAKKMVLAAALTPDHDFRPLWELAVMELDEPISMRSVARAEGGYTDTINGARAAWTPSDAYFVTIDDSEMGVMFPAERQFVSRWVDYAANSTGPELSEYLAAASQMTSEKVQIALAVDLTDVTNETEVRERLKSSSMLKESGMDIAAAASTISSLRGAVLRVAVGEQVQGQLRIDFDEPVAPLGDSAKFIVTQAMKDIGAEIEGIAGWDLELKDRAILMQGPLSEDDQRRVFSVIEIPSTKFSTLKDKAESEEEATESEVREASLTYYKSIDVLLKDLRRSLRGNKAAAAVQERYARKIDRMPILHVDPELLDFGTMVAQSLRGIALAKRQGGIDYGVGTAGMGNRTGTTGSSGYYGSAYQRYFNSGAYNYQAARESAAARSSMRASAMAGSKKARVEGFKMIEDAQGELRRRMTEKYQVEF
ncbi:MAG: hypothetical protein AAGA92_12685 [Planctomycetota bacterium]